MPPPNYPFLDLPIITSTPTRLLLSSTPTAPSSSDPILLPTPPYPKPALALTQLTIASTIGIVSLVIFAILRRNIHGLYGGGNKRGQNRGTSLSSNDRDIQNGRGDLQIVTNGLFSWIGPTMRITEQMVISHAGMDSFIVLQFFKFCFTVIGCFIFVFVFLDTAVPKAGKPMVLGMFTLLTYLLTSLTLFYLNKTTNKIIQTHQSSHSCSNSLTNRTVMVSGIPPELRESQILTELIESMLGPETVEKVWVCREWRQLNLLWERRDRVLKKLETFWKKKLDKKEEGSDINNGSFGTRINEDINIHEHRRYRDDEEVGFTRAEGEDEEQEDDESMAAMSSYEGSLIEDPIFHQLPPSTKQSESSSLTIRTGPLGLLGPKVQAIPHYTAHLQILNNSLVSARQHHYPTTSTAFITFHSATTAQICSQTLLDRDGSSLRVKMAPAMKDVNWGNIVLSRNERWWWRWFISLVIVAVSVGLVYPVSYVARLLNLQYLKTHLPFFGEYLESHSWANGLVTVLLPTYLFSMMNVLLPYVYDWLCGRQKFVSREEQHLSATRMNFFYLFVNLFLVFTFVGIKGTYKEFLDDSTRLATQLSLSLQSLSLFYTDLILLQGFALIPFKLLLCGSLVQWLYHKHTSFTARDLSKLYIPPNFTISQHLPQPMLIFLITLIYAPQSLPILLSSLSYFSLGYLVYKYQLCYCYSPLRFSTQGKLWPLIHNRIVFGLLIAQFVMIGTVLGVDSTSADAVDPVGKEEYSRYAAVLALVGCMLLTVWFAVKFGKEKKRLCCVWALRGISEGEGIRRGRESPRETGAAYQDQDDLLTEDWGSSGDSTRQTAHPQHGNYQNSYNTWGNEPGSSYAYPYLTIPLDGPWISLEKRQNSRNSDNNGNSILVVLLNETGDGLIRKKLEDVARY